MEDADLGYWKDVIEHVGGGNPAAYEDDYVCSQCFSDQGIKDFIEGEAQAKTCTLEGDLFNTVGHG